ncbi:predicted protein [Aspergillus nidulans FGSC A4]|uniref:Mid2 domain-containing protein n=1 Tax=Emericella nidulans (strain FGSC A4 / ATCC 38163 / CBS 112.46 / NRRL 194 / M139) TaxID=227321 RepID=Q5BHH4_EMENI|nr:hypothetical protein [Aspergillus nidulans FGSC A4]EAA65333.1 predicted protein [Aspergillus nidulans FGSC A4]CBF90380.1 TPA: conserved hypothetical protein [Aspergillus nidulans FGSC A4]|eukprot:XP_657618.1 predicted protein [Aspergillus nidulans FGSC A4]
MRWLSKLLAPYWFSLLPIRSHAWTFVWRDAQNNTHVPSGSSDFPCTEIANPPGMVFEYDADGDFTTFYVYQNTNCSGDPTGWAEHYHSKPASNFLGSFQIVDRRKTQSATASSTSSTASGDTPLSGGAIAGAVVGAVAGVALMGALVFVGVRRRNNKPVTTAGSAITSNGPAGSGVVPTLIEVQKDTLQPDERPMKNEWVAVAGSEQKPTRMAELPGDFEAVEMSDSHRVNEIEGTGWSLQSSRNA